MFFFCYTVFTMEKLIAKERKKNPKLAVNIAARDRERNYAPGMLLNKTFIVFGATGKSEMV